MPDETLDTSAVQRPGAFFGHITQTVRKIATDYFRDATKGVTLDIGCGNGLFFASLPQPTGRLIGTDLDLDLLHEAKQIFDDNRVDDIELVQGNVGTMPFLDGAFDNIFFLNTLINIPTDDAVRQMLDELMRICKPGGRILLDIRNAGNPMLRMRYWWHNRHEDFVTRGYHLRHLKGLFATKQFQIGRKTPIGSSLPFLAMGYVLEVRAPLSR